MSTPYEVLSRITSRPAAEPAGQRCEMCAEPVADEHRHVVDTTGRELMCVCRGCHLLFTEPGAALRYRSVPDRHLALPGLVDGPALWDALQIPVGLAALFRNSALDRLVAVYPGPAGATESDLDLAAWQEIAAADARLSLMADDVEVLLLRATPDGTQAFVIPVDRCYQFIGGLRLRWRGFDGGQEVSAFIDGFFADLDRRAEVVPR